MSNAQRLSKAENQLQTRNARNRSAMAGRSAELQLCVVQFVMFAQSWSSALRRHRPATNPQCSTFELRFSEFFSPRCRAVAAGPILCTLDTFATVQVALELQI